MPQCGRPIAPGGTELLGQRVVGGEVAQGAALAFGPGLDAGGLGRGLEDRRQRSCLEPEHLVVVDEAPLVQRLRLRAQR